jgi:hypothetical protein
MASAGVKNEQSNNTPKIQRSSIVNSALASIVKYVLIKINTLNHF